MAEAQLHYQTLMHHVEICVDKDLSIIVYCDRVCLKPKKKGSRPIVLSISQWCCVNKLIGKVERALDLVQC
jgi:hypothetical protein